MCPTASKGLTVKPETSWTFQFCANSEGALTFWSQSIAA